MPQILTSQDAYLQLSSLREIDIEEFWVMALRPDKNIIQQRCLFRGTVDACLVHPRDIFRFGCIENASSLLIAHNHPNAKAVPSEEDLKITEDIVKAGNLLQIPIIDHIIIGNEGYLSFRDEGWLDSNDLNCSFFEYDHLKPNWKH